MKLFRPGNNDCNERNRRIYALYEIVYTTVDFSAAIAFVVGSILFFYKDLQTAGTWFFLAGSILFALKPSLRLARELTYTAKGDLEPVAEGMNP